MILLIDNFDSFTWNLAAQLKKTGEQVLIFRNNEIEAKEIERLNPDGILISPGPGRPENAGNCAEIFDAFVGKIPILGICLGHQLIGEKLGINLLQSQPPVHGKTSSIFHDGGGLFRDIPQGVEMMRYHSLVLENFISSDKIEKTAETTLGTIMGIRNKFLKLEGLQFHPESILTKAGDRMMENWVRSTGR